MTTPTETETSIEVRRLNNEIARMLESAEIDKNVLRKKMMECISQKYKDLDTAIHTARKLQSEFERSADDSTERINRTVSEVILYTDLTVGIILLNGQLIRKENDT